MSRTRKLQEMWMTYFEEIFSKWQARKLTQENAVRLLGVRTILGVPLLSTANVE